MEAHGKVKSQFVDKDKKAEDGYEGAAKPQVPPAADLHRSDRSGHGLHGRNAHRGLYGRRVKMKRPDMTVTAKTDPRVS